MSKSFGYGLLNQKYNNLNNLLSGGAYTPTLQEVLDTGDTAQGILTINAPPSTITNQMRYDTQIISDAISNTTTHQTNGILVSNQPFGTDYGQLLKDRIKIQKFGYLTEIINDGTQLNVNGQVSFDNPPHSVDAINGNDLVTKGYVDSLVGQYSGGFNFFLNYSVVDGIYRSLGQSVVAAAQQIVPITTDTTNQLVGSFVSSALGITSIPSGIWNVLVFSEVAAIGGILTYFFEVYKLTGAVETLIFTSGNSTDVNATTTPTAFGINGTLTAPYAVLLTDKIVIKIYLHKDGTPQLVNTYFQNAYYSFVQSTLNAGTSLLSSNNTFTGTNNFTLGITTPSLDTATVVALNIGTTNAIPINIGRVGIITTIDGTLQALTSTINRIEADAVGTTARLYTSTTTGIINIGTSATNGIANLFTGTSRTGALNIQTGALGANNIFIGSATSATTIGNTLSVTSTALVSGNLLTNTQQSTTSGVDINSFANNITGNYNLLTTNTTGLINILTGPRSATTNIQTTAGSANILNLGSVNTTTTIAGGILSPSLDTATAVALNIGTTNATPINLGKVGMNTAIAGTATVAGTLGVTGVLQALTSTINNIQANGVSATMNSYITNTGGAYNLLTTNDGGIASLFTSATRTATLNIQSASASANIINIGSATSVTNILGLRAATLDSITSSVLSVGSNVLTTGINFNSKVLSGIINGVNAYTSVSTNTVLPTVQQLGYYLESVVSSATTSGVSNTITDLATYTLVPAGVWLFRTSFNINLNSVNQSSFSLSTTSATHNNWNIGGFATPALGGNFAQITGVITITAATSSVFFVCNTTSVSVSITNIRTSRLRIA